MRTETKVSLHVRWLLKTEMVRNFCHILQYGINKNLVSRSGLVTRVQTDEKNNLNWRFEGMRVLVKRRTAFLSFYLLYQWQAI